MMLAPILWLTPYLFIAKHMLRPLISNDKGPRLATSKNKDIQKMAAKPLPSYYSVINVLNVSDSLILSFSIVGIYIYKSKSIIRNKDS